MKTIVFHADAVHEPLLVYSNLNLLFPILLRAQSLLFESESSVKATSPLLRLL